MKDVTHFERMGKLSVEITSKLKYIMNRIFRSQKHVSGNRFFSSHLKATIVHTRDDPLRCENFKKKVTTIQSEQQRSESGVCGRVEGLLRYNCFNELLCGDIAYHSPQQSLIWKQPSCLLRL